MTDRERLLQWFYDEVMRQMNASEPQPKGGQSVGVMPSRWNMTPTTRHSIRRLLDAVPAQPRPRRTPADADADYHRQADEVEES